MKLSPQLRLAVGLVPLLFSVALIGDTLGLLPRPEDQIRDARKLLAESLAVQLSSAAGSGDNDAIAKTLATIVRRNESVVFGELTLESGKSVASYGSRLGERTRWYDLSTLDSLVVPIY